MKIINSKTLETGREKWVSFYPGFSHIDFRYSTGNYYDMRHYILLNLGFGSLYIYLPFDSGHHGPEVPQYGFYYYERALWFSMGKKTKSIDMPYSYQWVRTSYLLDTNEWLHQTKANRKEDFFLREDLWQETHPYIYTLKDGTIQNRIATIKIEECEWRWKALKLLGFPKKISRVIDVKFNDEVGERTGSWKGGCLGCNYKILQNESPLQCLRRMESERTF